MATLTGKSANHRVVVRRQIGLRSKQQQDVSDDLQPSEQVLGMLLIIRAPCRCLDPTEGRVPGTEGFLDRTKHTVFRHTAQRWLVSACISNPRHTPECFVFERHFDPSSGKTSLMIYNRPARQTVAGHQRRLAAGCPKMPLRVTLECFM